jgi:glycosyltransferase involved in cell wall biosynthesis
LRIALDVRWLRGGRIDGIGQVVTSLTPELAKSRDHEFVLVYQEAWTRDELSAKLGEADVLWRQVRYPVLSMQDVVLLPRDLRRAGVDAFYTFNYPTSPLHRGYRVAGMVQDLIPFLYPRNVGSSRAVWRLFHATTVPTRLLLQSFDAVHVPSAQTRQDIARLFPGVDSKVRVAPYAVTPPRAMPSAQVGRELEALGLTPGYVLYVGRFDPYKNVPALISAHRTLPETTRAEHPLVLVGRPSEDVERSTAGDPRIVATGPLADLEAIYRGALVFVYPSLYEGFGLPPLEAMSRNVPVITTNRASLPEVVGDAAILTDGSSTALGSALSELLGNAKKREELGRAGLEQAKRFDWSWTARQILQDLGR